MSLTFNFKIGLRQCENPLVLPGTQRLSGTAAGSRAHGNVCRVITSARAPGNYCYNCYAMQLRNRPSASLYQNVASCERAKKTINPLVLSAAAGRRAAD